MMDNKFCSSPHQKENICIDTYRVLDSCRDKDCFENVRVYLTDFGEEIIDRTSVIRAKCAKIVSAYIDINDVPFNRGFYQLNIKMYVKIIFEACISQGNVQEFEGVAVVEKKVILYGSEGNVNVFKSTGASSDFCAIPEPCCSTKNLPVAIVEAVDPIILSAKVREPEEHCCCCCCCNDIPTGISASMNGNLCDSEGRYISVSMGIFSVVRLVRTAQYIINATEYCIPEKECISADDDNPCAAFRNMPFPAQEFCLPDFTPARCEKENNPPKCGCGS